MDVMGFHLGLSPPGVDSSFAPARLVASEVLRTRKHLQENEIYIGPGHFSHRWPLSQWQNPFRAGEGRTSSESVLQFARWIHDQAHLLDALPSLHGCTLICDCPHNQLCHGDVIRALIFGLLQPRGLHFHDAASKACARWLCWLRACAQSGRYPSGFHRRQ